MIAITKKTTSIALALALSLGLLSTVTAQVLSDQTPGPRGDPSAEAHAQRVQRQSAIAEAQLQQGRSVLAKLADRHPELRARHNAAELALSQGRGRATHALTTLAGGLGISPGLQRQANDELVGLLTMPSRQTELEVPAAATQRSLAPIVLSSAPRAEPGPADLAATLDAPITPAIQAQADALSNEPVAIFEWVRKEIAFVPSTGSLQGAAGTLQTRRGNPTDQASLLIALLRASGVHSRYVSGQLELDSLRLTRWLGVDRIEAVTELFVEGGIPFATVISGGAVSALSFEHVWVEAWIDFAPSRGARQRQGDAWVGLDPSYKDLSYQPGLDLTTLMALDENGIRTAITAAAVVDQGGHYLSALGADALGTQLSAASARLREVLASRGLLDAQVAELLPHADDETPNYPFFLGNLPYKVLVSTPPVSSLTAEDRHHLSWTWQDDANGLPGAQLVALNQPTVALAGKDIELRFVPAAEVDRDTLLALLPETLTSFDDLPDALPAYLIELKAELWLDDTLVASSDAIGMGRVLHSQLQLQRPDGIIHTRTDTAFCGETRALNLSWHGGLADELAESVDALRAAQQALADGTTPSASALTKALLQVAGRGHYAASDAYQTWLAGIANVAFYRASGANESYTALEIAAPFGVITTAYAAGFALSDVSPAHLGAPLTDGNEQRFVHQSLGAQAAFGHSLLERIYRGDGRSSARVFRAALDDQQAVYHYQPAQVGDLPGLSLPNGINDPILAALSRGDTSDFIAAPRQIGDWNGYGVQIQYPGARGGSSFVYGQSRPETGTHRTGASVSSAVAKGALYTGLLGVDAPPVLLVHWQTVLDDPIGAGDGLTGIATDPLGLGLSDTLIEIIAGSVLDHLIGDDLDPVIDSQVWTGLVLPVLDVAPLIDPIQPIVNLLINPGVIDLGQSTQINASATDNEGVVSLVVSAEGETVNLVNGQADYTPSHTGVVPIIARARDEAGNIGEQQVDLLVRSPGDNAAPVVEISDPLDNADVFEPTDIIGSVSDDSLRSWQLQLRPGNSPEVEPIILGEGSESLSNAVLGTVDPTQMFNGVYVLTLVAEDANGLVSETTIQVRLDGDMKIGNFRISFEEIEIPLQGIPIRITRTYDTRQSKEKLDFGYGWSIDYQNVRVRESRKLGFSWQLAQQGGGFSSFCVRPAGTPMVSVTLPNGETEQFNAKWAPECQQFLPPIDGLMVFEPANGKTHSTLEQTSYGQLRLVTLPGGATNLVNIDEPDEPADPSDYKLTTEDGMVYFLDQDFGVERIVDQAGNFVHYTHDAIIHSTGVAIHFIRDDEDRITDIVLPDGRRLSYRYNNAGDLIEVSDPIGQKMTLGYLPNVRYPHYLETIADARGVEAVRHEYDDDGRLIATTDANGERIEYQHNIAGKVEVIKNRRGHATTYVYDDNGYVLSETNALGEQTLRTYDPNGVELSRTDPLGRSMNYTVDVRGNTLTQTDPLGNITTSTYGSFSQLKTEVDPLGRATARNNYWINSLTGIESGFLTGTTDALDNLTRFSLDLCGSVGCGNSGNIRAMVDAAGNRTDFGYDRQGNLLSETDALGNAVTRTYDAMNRPLTETRTRVVDGVTESLVTQYAYDGKGRLTQTTMPDGSISTNTYNAIDKVETSTDAVGRVTRYEYDDRGYQSAVIHADGARESMTYDPEGNVVAQTDRAGRTTKMIYDAANRLTETTYPDDTPGDDSDNPRNRTEYDAAGQMVASIDAGGNRTEFRYDAAGRQIETEDALGQIMTTAYDAAGQRSSVTDALGRTTKFVYDVAGRMVLTIHPDDTAGDDSDNQRTAFSYDALGRKVAEIDEVGRTTRYGYDKLSRLIQVILPNPTTGANPELIDGQTPTGSGTLVTRYDYDEQGNKTAQIDALGRTTRWTYDIEGRPSTRILPMGQIESYSYDDSGQRTGHTTFNGEQIGMSYDTLGRPATVTLPGNYSRTFSYTTSSQIAQIDDDGQIYAFAYDERNRLVSATDPYGRNLHYGYDVRSNRTKLSSDRQQIRYDYDVLSRLREVVANVDGGVEQISTYAYDPVGNRAGMVHPNGTAVEYGYDVRNRLQTLIHRASQTAGAAALLSLSYQVDASGLRTQIAETRQGATTAITRTADYTYDAVKRLVREKVIGTNGQARTSNWTYNAVGNRTRESTFGSVGKSVNYTYDDNDRLTRHTGTGGTTDYVYDAAGNTLQKKRGTTIDASYAWDAENRMVSATRGSGTDQVVTSYSYDPNGIRRAQEVQSGGVHSRTEYLVDPNQAYAQVLEEWASEGAVGSPLGAESLDKLFVYGDDLISQTVAGLAGADAITHVYHYDGLGTTRALSAVVVDSSGVPGAGHGEVTDRYAYTAYGEEDPAGSSGNNTNTADNDYRYTGEQLDAELGFYYLRARYYEPGNGRLHGMDGFAGVANDPLSLHKYTYVHSNPVSNLDPSGNITILETLTAINVFAFSYSVGGAGYQAYYGNYDEAKRVAAEGVVYFVLGAAAARPVAWLGKSAFNLFASAYRFRTAKQILGKGHSSKFLTTNMEAALGTVKPWGYQAHHLVGKAYAEGRAAVRILEKKGIDINSPLNGVFLPGCGKGYNFAEFGGLGPVVHCGNHNRNYAKYVLRALLEAGGESASKRKIINVLSRVREDLNSGAIRLNKWK